MIISHIILEIQDILNKLFCTFSKKEALDYTISKIENSYTILFSKIFILELEGEEDFICSYNVDTQNMSRYSILPGTILMHRRKETDTLYTINSLNMLITKLNGGILDKTFKIDWAKYKNSVLLTRNGEFAQIKTNLYKTILLK